MATSTNAPTLTIVHLQDLNAFSEVAFTANYLHNLTTVFTFDTDDIPTVLTPRNLNTLKGLRKDLLTMAESISPDLTSKTVLTRKSKEDVINDILLLSESLVRPEQSIDLSSLYASSVSEVNIIDVVSKLLSEVNALKSENKTLRDRVAALEARHHITAASHDTPANAVNSEEDRSNNDNTVISEEDHNNNDNDDDQKELDALDNYVPVFAAPRPAVTEKTPRPAVTEKSFVGIRNVDPSCSRRSIMNHLSVKKVFVTLDDIEDMPSTNKSKRTFKVAVPLNQVQQALANWPLGIEARRWATPPTPLSTHSQKFRKGHTNYPRRNSEDNNHKNWSQWTKTRQTRYNSTRN